ncbi:armadillo-type protein [Mycena maculata]|uniref:Armadillo-type protein n=1 Tax=Mycena maculata TaxID=230809 RepID=A0AAD7HWZ1_9AGAR|nr:armadillo-type protein [Mycena maculata]
MESLLRWGIENSTSATDASTPAPRQDLDPAIIDMILGKSDAELMKECMAVAVDESQSESARVDTLDRFEELIEQIDNANNIEKLKMWSPLHSLIQTATPDIKVQALWVIGTALQNNPAAQDAYLAYDPLPVLISFLAPPATAEARAKAIYALSGLLKHNAPAVARFSEIGGWDALRNALQNPDDPKLNVRRKVLFLLNTLLIPSTTPPAASSSAQQPIHANSHAASLADPARTDTSALTLRALKARGLLAAVVAGLGSNADPEHLPDFEEKSIGLLRTYALACDGKFSADETKALHNLLKDSRAAAQDRWGLSGGEYDELLARVTP